MTSKTDKVGEIFMTVWMEACDSKNPYKTIDNVRHALLEVIKAELPERMDTPLTEAAGVEVDIENINYGYNQALTEVNAILERLFKC